METKSRPTMMDVAARAGVSQATVSLVLSGSPGARFSAATRSRVQQAAEDLGYRRTLRAEPAPGGAARTILFMADEISTDPWMSLAFDGLRDKALEHGVTAALCLARNGEMADICAQFAGPHLLGLVCGTILTREIDPPRTLLETPSVLLNCYDPARRLPSVLPGDLVGGRSATEHLIRRGRRRIAYINGQEGLDAARDRLRGYRQALASNDMAFDPDLVRPGNWEPSSGYDQTHALMALPQPPDAIFCANDLIAVGCYEALKDLGRSIPGDVAVVGFDDREIAQFMRPPLTTLVLPQYEMGEIAAELLLDRTGGLAGRHDQLKVECRLIDRQSA